VGPGRGPGPAAASHRRAPPAGPGRPAARRRRGDSRADRRDVAGEEGGQEGLRQPLRADRRHEMLVGLVGGLDPPGVPPAGDQVGQGHVQLRRGAAHGSLLEGTGPLRVVERPAQRRTSRPPLPTSHQVWPDRRQVRTCLPYPEERLSRPGPTRHPAARLHAGLLV
jgi:hypothetical protein